MAPPMPGGYGLATFGPVGGIGHEAAFYSGSTQPSPTKDRLTSRVLPAIQELQRADFLRAYHRPRKKESSSSWALVRSVGRKISGLWPFWSDAREGEDDDESVIRRLGKSSRRLRPAPPMHGRGRYNGMNRVMPRLDRGPMVGALWSVSVEPGGDDMDGEDDYMVIFHMLYFWYQYIKQLVPLLSVLPSRRLLLHAVRADAAVEDAETAFLTFASGLDEGRGQQSWKAEAEVEEAPKVEEKTRCVVTQDLILK